MADIETLKRALINADKAGDVAAATALAKALREQMTVDQGPEQPSRTESFIRGAAQGATFNLADEIAGGAAQKKALWQEATNRDRLRAMNEARLAGDWDAFRALQKEIMQGGMTAGQQATEQYRQSDTASQEANPGSFLAGNLGGAVATLPITGGASFTARLGQGAGMIPRMVAGAKDAAVYGSAYGAGAGEDIQDRVTGGLAGAVVGGTIGAAVPPLVSGVKNLGAPVIDAFSARINPDAYGARKLAERMASDGTDLTQVGARMERQPGLSVVDVSGENSRNLLRTITNVSGPAQNRVQTQLRLKQMGQGDRLKDAISRTFADPDGYLSVKDEIAAIAKREAAPLYERAYANPVPFTRELENLLSTPSGKVALQKAVKLAGDEQAPFKQWFANIADDGTVTIKRVPDMRAWDYIKRGFDDVIDRETDNITGKMTTAGRAVVGLKNKLLRELDDANPAYAQARKVASDGFRMDEALEFGRKAGSMSAQVVSRKFAAMSEAEKQAARVGYAEAMRKKIDGAGWTHNKVRQLLGSPEQYRVLRAMSKTPGDFKALRSAIFNEARKQKTFDAVRGNSTTARQLADMQEAGGMQEGLGLVRDASTGNIAGLINATGNILRRIGGLTPETADAMAKRLMTSNPQSARQVIQELQAINARRLTSAQKASQVQSIISRVTAQQSAQ